MPDNPRELAEYQSDHDLLVVLNERVATLTIAVERKNDDHEARIRDLESAVEGAQSSNRTWKYVVAIAMGILTLIIAVIAAYISRA
jgi:hypothetical protein